MKERMIRLNDTYDVREFVGMAEQCDFDINLIYQHNVYIDAKSMLGVLGLLRQDMKVSYAGENAGFDRIVDKYAVA